MIQFCLDRRFILFGIRKCASKTEAPIHKTQKEENETQRHLTRRKCIAPLAIHPSVTHFRLGIDLFTLLPSLQRSLFRAHPPSNPLLTVSAMQASSPCRGSVCHPRVVLRCPPQRFLNEIAGFKTISRSYLLKYGVPRHPPRRLVDCYTFANKKIYVFFSIVSFLVSSSHETFLEENRWFWGALS